MNKETGNFDDWTQRVKDIDYDSNTPLTAVTVPTIETVA